VKNEDKNDYSSLANLKDEKNVYSIDENNENNKSPGNENKEIVDKNEIIITERKSNKTSKIRVHTTKKLFYIELIKKHEEEKKNHIGKLELPYCDILGIIFCTKFSNQYKKKRDLYYFAYNEMQKYMDYLDIIKLLQEFTKLKLVMLSDKQLNLFSFMSKPQITFNSNNTFKNSFLHGKVFEKNNISLHELFEIFVETLENNKKGFIDKRIIDNMDLDLKDTFQMIYKNMKKTID